MISEVDQAAGGLIFYQPSGLILNSCGTSTGHAHLAVEMIATVGTTRMDEEHFIAAIAALAMDLHC